MNLRLLFTLPLKPPKQSDEERRKETVHAVMRRMALKRILTADEVECTATNCLKENHARRDK